MSDPSPDPSPAPRRVPLALAVVAAVLLLRVPVLAWTEGSKLFATCAAAHDALFASAGARIESTVGLSPDSLALLRRHLPPDGRLVTYCPYPGEAWEKILRDKFEQLKNLLYPTPRDAHFAQTAAALQRRIDAAFVGKLVVVDGTQENVELPIAAEFELLGEQRFGPVRLRFWMLRKVGP